MDAADVRDIELAKARVRVGDHLHAALTETIYSGSKSLLAMRLSDVAEAEKTGDSTLLRASLMELSLASASWAATLDAELPSEMRSNGSRKPIPRSVGRGV